MKILITGGGSGGHVSPALATLEELKNKVSKAKIPLEILFIGGKLGMEGGSQPSIEQKILPQTNIPHVFIHAGKLQRYLSLATFYSLWGVLPGLLEAFYYLWKFKPDLIFSTGGFVTVPVVVAGWLLRIPILIHEQTATVGLANKIGGRLAQKVAVSFHSSAKEFPQGRVLITGNPLRPQILWAAAEQERRRQELGQAKGAKEKLQHIPNIYITGGAQGSHIINEIVQESLAEILERGNVIHQCGSNRRFNDFEKLSKIAGTLPDRLKKRYQVKEYLNNQEIGKVFAQTDLVITRAGANTINELAAVGIPAILIPIPWVTHNEQYKNARILVNAGSAVVIPEDELDHQRLLSELDTTLANWNEFQEKAVAFRKEVPLDAASKLADEIIQLAKTKSKSLA